jgi:CheY-like chemotaxis protein
MESLRIVVVDDEPAQRELIGGFLTKQGHEVFAAGSGAEALAHVRDRQVDLVLSDCRMPGMSGPDLLRKIKALNP